MVNATSIACDMRYPTTLLWEALFAEESASYSLMQVKYRGADNYKI
jgi:hypothetical protein